MPAETARVLFVCHGNICRSPMAQYVMQYLVDAAGRSAEFVIDSAATDRDEVGSLPHPGTRKVLESHGIPCGRHHARLVTKEDGKRSDLIVIMDAENLRHLRRILEPDDLSKVSKLMSFAGEERDVADPWYTGDFETTFRDVSEGCSALLQQLTSDKQ